MTPTLLVSLLGAAVAGSFLLSLVLTIACRRVARRIGFVDRPGGHKSHREAIPYAGGVAVFLAAWVPISLLLMLAWTVPQAWIADNFGEVVRAYAGGIRARSGSMLLILTGGLMLHLLGLYDDRRPLPATIKLTVMLGVGLLVSAFGGVRLAEFAGPLPSMLLTTVWMVVVVNAFNFLDNMDGLSSGVALICLAFFAACGLMNEQGQVLVPGLAGVFFGAIAGFWVFNFPPAKIFMGDAGSLLIGYMLAIISVRTTYLDSGAGTPPFALAMPLVILAVPLYDFVSVVTIRLAEGRSPLRGDQRHFSHRLVERGLSRRFAVLTIYVATAATGLGATLLPGADLLQTLTILLQVSLVLALIAILEAPLRGRQ
ncbi:MAG: undecaprenyl/decaprenyl-phosphate alpha-N-acetylglucosaminyl 1-phosphate transferase [Planctomycetes bacterium]|nr:undecaprenyl/decaprenyl-phosphate alpha-N-acetylglucosaminyl 1-phosphate transferase [Planctomycetota bacterium]